VRALIARWPAWWPWALAVALTSPLALYWWNLIAAGSVAFDWRIFVEAGERFWARSPDLYEVNDLYSFRHSPLFALAMPAIAWIGALGVRLASIGVVLLLPTWPMRILALASWPFAMDLQHGALTIALACVAVWAVRGSRTAGIAFIGLTLLSPRPLMLPIAAYLLWQRRDIRIPSVFVAIASVVGVALTGYGDDWITMLRSSSLDALPTPLNLSPSRLVGAMWIPIGVSLAALLTWRRHPGWAALAINPYVLPHYLLFLLVEWRASARSPAEGPPEDARRSPDVSRYGATVDVPDDGAGMPLR
jgi:hypothetical protein